MSEQKYKPSRPFSNGAEGLFFYQNFCRLCTKYKVDDSGIGAPDNCPVEEAIAHACYNEIAWPEKDVVQAWIYSHVCLRFLSDNEKLMQSYRELFREDGAEND